jgi:predicted nicotinamide N-methyase
MPLFRAGAARAFVRRHTVLRGVPGLEGAQGLARVAGHDGVTGRDAIAALNSVEGDNGVAGHADVAGPDRVAAHDGLRLHLAEDLLAVWHATQLELADEEAPLPYWSAAWAGGLAMASYLRERPEVVAGRRVLDFGSGSGLCAIAAMQAGAASVVAVDIDPFAIGAIQVNARANNVKVTALRRDLLGEPPPADVDVVLAADCWYEAGFAAAVTPWLRRVRDAGIDVLIGDPGRRFLPKDDLVELALYEVRTTAELEDLDQHAARVYRFR